MAKYYKLKIEFNGTRYLGWQLQKKFSPTVQGELNKACQEIFKSSEIHTIGSGRTDTGVHSLGHIVKLKAPFEINFEALKKGLNSKLPDDIKVLEVDEVLESFRPTNDAIKKEYKYLFTTNKEQSAFQDNIIVNTRFDLDIDEMRRACKVFIGTHDFSDFECTGSDTKSKVREIFECDLLFHKSNFHGIFPDHYVLRVVGSGFLKQMVRLMVGTLWSIGRGKSSIEDLEKSLKNPTGKKLGATAPPSGLYKTKVWY